MTKPPDLAEFSSLPFSDLWMSEDNDLEAKEWSGATGDRWGDRNPRDVAGTNASWKTRFGIDKVSVLREAAAGVPRGTTWLEVGCSQGAHMRCMQAAGFEKIVGCDVNLPSLAHCDAAVHADARHLPFADNAVGGITTSGSLIHMGPHDRMVDCLNEMTRVAREWLLFAELYNTNGKSNAAQIVSFGDLMPPAWVMPWSVWLTQYIEPGWVITKTRVISPYDGSGSHPIILLLLRRVSET